MRVGIQESEIKDGLADGGQIRNVFITSELEAGEPLYRIYIWPNWLRHFLPLRSYADRSDRTYRDLDRAVLRVREFGYLGYIMLHEATDPSLDGYRTLPATMRPNKPLKPRKPPSD